ncbi:MAG: glycosyltransferase family 2 protein [Patescibacteria group bacterium]
MNDAPDTAVIILNWNGRCHLQDCLSTVLAQRTHRQRVMVVDNGSTDDSVVLLRQMFPTVQIIQTGKNLGFAEGNNVGIRQALQDPQIRYIAVLNNDTAVDGRWLESLIAVAEADKHIGAVGSRMMRFYERDVFDSAGDFVLAGTLKVVTRGAGERDRGQYRAVEECFSARGGAALYRREMLEDVRLGHDYFDSHYFAYAEDSDLSIRARLRSWKIMYAPDAVVYHKVSATTKTLSSDFMRYHTGRNRVLTTMKNLPFRLWVTALRGTAHGPSDESATVGYWRYVRIVGAVIWALPRLVRLRRLIQRRRTISIHDILQWQKYFSIPHP